MRIAYLTSVYARASDSFVRGEVIGLRRLGSEVLTFSVRRAAQDASLSAEIRNEQAGTVYLLEQGVMALVWSMVSEALRSPFRWSRAVGVALKVSTPGFRGRLLPIIYLAEACVLAKFLRASDVKHIHNHIGENSASVAMMSSVLTSIPFSLTIHGPGEFDHPHELALGLKVAKASFTAAISDFTKSQLCRWVSPEFHERIKIVRCGIDPEFFKAMETDIAESQVFTCIGRLAEQKGHIVLLRALAELRDRGRTPEVRIIGDGPLRATLIEVARDLGLDRQIKFLGNLAAADIRKQLSESRAMVLPSFAEGLPVVIMEALAVRRPVISTYIAGIPELVTPGEVGWLVPAGNVSMLADAMAECLDASRECLDRMGQKGVEAVLQRHDSNKEVAKLASHIASAAKEPIT